MTGFFPRVTTCQWYKMLSMIWHLSKWPSITFQVLGSKHIRWSSLFFFQFVMANLSRIVDVVESMLYYCFSFCCWQGVLFMMITWHRHAFCSEPEHNVEEKVELPSIWDAMTLTRRHWNVVAEPIKPLLWVLLAILIADSSIKNRLGVITTRTFQQFSCLKPIHPVISVHWLGPIFGWIIKWPRKMWGGITYLFPNFAIENSEWICSYILHILNIITYPC